jgi:hypothetical protein
VGIMDILNNIDFKDIAMGMALASQGNTAVPNVMNIIEKQRIEDEAKQKAKMTNDFMEQVYTKGMSGVDPTLDLMRRDRAINAMPDTVTQYDTSKIPSAVSNEELMASMIDPTLGIVKSSPEDMTPAWNPADITKQEVSNPAKEKAKADFILSVAEAKKSMPNVADAIGSIWPQFRDKDLDPHLVSSAFAALYGQNEKKMMKLLEFEEKHQLREETAKEKKSKITWVDPTHSGYDSEGKLIVQGRDKEEKKPYVPGHIQEFTVGDKQVYKEYQADGTWKDVPNIGGPRYKPTAEKPEKPEYTAKQALSIVSKNNMAINRIKSSGKIDHLTAILNPTLAAAAGTSDPKALAYAVASLEQERDYAQQFLPKGMVPKTPPVENKTRDLSAGVDFIKKATSKEDAIARAKQLKDKGWSKEDINEAGKLAGY